MTEQWEKDFEDALLSYRMRSWTNSLEDAAFKDGYKAALEKSQEREKKLVDALRLACEGSKIFEKFADCRRDTWSCKCEFCRDHTSAAYLRRARQTLKELGYE